VDYLIALFVEWKQSAFDKNTLLPSSVEYRLVRASDGVIIKEGRVDGIADSADAANHAARSASLIGASAAKPCIDAINALSAGGEQ